MRVRKRRWISSHAALGLMALLGVQCTGNPQAVKLSPKVSMVAPPEWQMAPVHSHNLYEFVRASGTQPGAALKVRVAATSELRTDHDEALQRLQEVAAEAGGKLEFRTLCGWPALERRAHVQLAQVLRRDRQPFDPAALQTTVVTVAAAVGDTLVRFEGTLDPGAEASYADEVVAMSEKIGCAAAPKGQTEREVEQLKALQPSLVPPQIPTAPAPATAPAAAPAATPPAPAAAPTTTLAPQPSTTTFAPESEQPSTPSSDLVSLSPQAARRQTPTLVQSGVGEVSIAVSSDGQNILVAANSGDSVSSNGGGSYTGVGTPNFGFGQAGDPSVGTGASGNFYYATIGFPTAPKAGCAATVGTSTNHGQSFTFTGNAAFCPQSGAGMCFTDQEQMAVDSKNKSSSGGDQLYMVWRNFPAQAGVTQCQNISSGNPTPTISCSTDSGKTWQHQTAVGTGDVGRPTVGPDGFVYVTYISGSNLMINKYSSCNSGLVQQSGFPKTVSSFTGVNCPIPGLDRCSGGEDSSPQAAVDDNNSKHVLVAYASSTSSSNENVIVRESLDGGATWPNSTTANNASVTARRFMPWICVSQGVAQVTWYDRRAATATQNSLTGYYWSRVYSNGGLLAGGEVNVSGTVDDECASGFACSVDAVNDASSCQPKVNNVNGSCQNAAGGGSGKTCNLISPVCPAGESCQVGGGCPKYGDYNANACAAGKLFMAWTSATPPSGVTGAPAGLAVYSDVERTATGGGIGEIWRYTGTPCSGDACGGWQKLDNNAKTLQLAAGGGSLYQLHNDGMIWQYTGTPCNIADQCPGWQRLDDNVKAVNIVADGGNLYQLHDDGMIWRYTGTPCNGDSCPGWQRLDDNPKTVSIVSSGGNLYQLQNDGWIWKFTGTACNGDSCPGWQRLDRNSKAIAIVADGGNLYQLHNDGMIWRYTGTPCNGDSCPGWQRLDRNVKAVAIVAGGGNLYQLHNDGKIWQYTGTPCSGDSCPGWRMLDENHKTIAIVAGGSQLYQQHNDGWVWRYTGTPCSGDSCPGWERLDNNAQAYLFAASDSSALYQLHTDPVYQMHNNGKIWRYTGPPCDNDFCPGWQMMDDNPAAIAIATAGRMLYQLHNTGKVWRALGSPCSGNSCPAWEMMDDNTGTTAIAAAGRALYQLHSDGSIWRALGAPCSGDSCPAWQMLDNNPAAAAIAAAGRMLFQLHRDGSIWRSTGDPCNGSSCPGWEELDNNPAAIAIAAAGARVYQLHNDGSIWRSTGAPCSGGACPGWEKLDDNPAATGIVAAGNQLFQTHSDGSIWRSTGDPCSGNSCPGWQMIDNNPNLKAIAASGARLTQLHKNGWIWKADGTPCNGNSCPFWHRIDDNPVAQSISVGGFCN